MTEKRVVSSTEPSVASLTVPGGTEVAEDPTRPAWQRIIAGDAKDGYDTQRAFNTRHIMMIGVCLRLFPSIFC
jgi:hypothetical protein